MKLTKEDRRFSNIVKTEFLEKIMKYGEVPSYVDFYRPCKFIEEKSSYYIYAYPETKDKETLYKLYCPKSFVEEALNIYAQHKSLLNSIVELYKMEGIDE